ncbi:FAD-binding oxidoreductase [Sphingobium sp. B2]|uniref:FAD-binding oxidoreductase n=1 Tax=Sphingobium sp. B2 TaxID=2583228 RepID=UPI0011A2FD38|nr:FAD-binding oxidoreductase [Sphingobium sp. B2]
MTSLVSIANSDISFPCEPDERILDAAERAGYTMAYSCRKGVCVTCRSNLTQGKVKIAPFGSPKHAGEEILCCMAIPDGPVEIAPPWIEERRQPARVSINVTVHKMDQRSDNVAILHLRLPIGRRVPFAAGQYISVAMEGGESRNYSIANPPRLNDIVELHVRHIPGGMFSDTVLKKLRPGDVLNIALPFGLFTWSDDHSVPAIMLATGTGFAPLKSMIQELIDRKISRPVHLFWGGEREADIYELELVTSWARRLSWFDFTPVLANPGTGWTGERGFVQNAVTGRYDDLSGYSVYACGNPIMIEQARALLVEQRSLSAENFHSDAFVFSGQAEIAAQPAA